MVYVLSLYAVLVASLTAAEVLEKRVAQRVLKPLAALGFLIIAFFSTALFTTYGQIIFAGLLACAVGDIFLLSRKSPKLFLAGMAAFAIGHLAYSTAFLSYQTADLTPQGFVFYGAVILGSLGFYIWLRPRLPKDMRLAVAIYTLIILAMVVSALGLMPLGYSLYAMIGAVLFAISDIFVARDRFVKRDPKNALAITPLYFGAQALIAISTRLAF